MTSLTRIAAVLVSILGSCSMAWPQVTVDVSKITCEQMTLFKVTDPQNIAVWLSGYYHGKRNDTIVETQQLNANMNKIKDYCRQNPATMVMQAVETVFGLPK